MRIHTVTALRQCYLSRVSLDYNEEQLLRDGRTVAAVLEDSSTSVRFIGIVPVARGAEPASPMPLNSRQTMFDLFDFLFVEISLDPAFRNFEEDWDDYVQERRDVVVQTQEEFLSLLQGYSSGGARFRPSAAVGFPL